VPYLRGRTVRRSLHAYRVWVGRAIGWWSVLYLVFWIVVFLIAGLETIVPRSVALPVTVTYALSALAAAAFLSRLATGRAPPVVLDRRDLYRLGLAPVSPRHALRFRFTVRRVLVGLAGAVLGAGWSVLAPAAFHLSAPWAAPALALVGLTWLDVTWLRYAGFRRKDAAGGAARRAALVLATAFVVMAAVGAVAHARGWPAPLRWLDPLAPLRDPSPVSLVVPALLALAGFLATRRSLASVWPPRFAAQSLVLTQLQAMRTFQMLAGMAGMGSAAETDVTARERLLAALHDRPGATKPRRSLRPPPTTAPVWRGIAWRSWQALYRRPRFAQARVALLTVSAATAAWGAARVLAGVTRGGASTAAGAASSAAPGAALDGAALSAGMGGSFLGAIGVLLASYLVARAGAALMGPSLPRSTLPIEPSDRTRGRLTPAMTVLLVALAPAYFVLAGADALAGGGFDVSPATAFGAAPGATLLVLMAVGALLLTCLAGLEKYASWSGAAASRWEPQLVAALVTALPMLVLTALGAPTWALPAQFLLLAVIWLISV
jgi:hypothetical protein